MKNLLRTALTIFAVALVSACSEDDMNHFLASGPGDWSAAGSGSGSGSAINTAPPRCYQTSRTHQTCFN